MSRGAPNWVTWNGERVSLRGLAARCGINLQTIYSRFRRSKSLDVVRLTRPIDVREINLDFIRAQREQLFAEAVALYQAGCDWWEVPQKDAEREQEERRDDDVWQPRIEAYLHGKSSTNVPDILQFCLEIDPDRQDKRAQMRVTSILRVLGFIRKLERQGVTVLRVWKRVQRQRELL